MHTLSTRGHKIFCENCGFEREIDNRYAFKNPIPFKNFSEWYSWQLGEFERMIKESESFSLTDSVHLKSPSVTGDTLLRMSGSGICTLDRTGLKFVGRKDGEPHELFFPINSMYRLLFGAGENFEIYEGKEIWYFQPDEPRGAVMWYVVSGLLKKLQAME